ncbi:hypothetical protein WI80_00090 [Burkholderia ubonensis]|uniref:hypothetical protein n=1 Tax=Burkholderia ubonensis TaxID=101571 RepID=UPI000753679B|nr:hypothetical protein [Burkholderia ubonensis]KVD16121.1 hypothetical protein WI80_00090 [Burkholderia ubonensis]KVU24989.1 hypothetical protein WK63_25380 [Burkholderia ubonensis]
MALSLIRGLTASVYRNLASLKRDAKRLQRQSQRVFGAEYPLSTCQQAVAVSRGFKSFADIEKLGARLGFARSDPFWTIQSRNDSHQQVLEALYRLELEVSEMGPVVFLGEQGHAILPALVLFFEEMSHRKVPSLLLVETKAQSVQDTVIAAAIAELGFDETFEGFRSLDLRETALPVSLHTNERYWVGSIVSALPKNTQQHLTSGWDQRVERSAREDAEARHQLFGTDDFRTIPFYSVKTGVAVANSTLRRRSRNRNDCDGSDADVNHDALEQVASLVEQLDAREFSAGVSVEHESLRRPYVALFSRDDPASVVLAGALHSLFSERYAKPALRDHRPSILYVSDRAEPYAPACLSFGNHSMVVNGLSDVPTGDGDGEFYGYKNALKVRATFGGVQFMGTRVPVPSVSIGTPRPEQKVGI